MGIDWRYLFTTWLFLSIWLGLGGGFINRFTQTDESIVINWIVMSVSALVAGAFSLDGDLSAQFSKTLLLAIPVLAMSLLITATLRWLGVHHAENLEKGPELKRRGIAILIVIAVAIGGLTGSALTRWDKDTVRGVQNIHSRLQDTTVNPSQLASLFPVGDVPGLEAHLGIPYTLYGRPSGQSVVAAEARANFHDGYQLTCVLLIFPDVPPFLQACAEGGKVSLPVNQ